MNESGDILTAPTVAGFGTGNPDVNQTEIMPVDGLARFADEATRSHSPRAQQLAHIAQMQLNVRKANFALMDAENDLEDAKKIKKKQEQMLTKRDFAKK